MEQKRSKSRLRIEAGQEIEYGYRLLQRTTPRNLPGIDLYIDSSQKSLTRNNSNFNSPRVSLGHSGSVQQLSIQEEPYINDATSNTDMLNIIHQKSNLAISR